MTAIETVGVIFAGTAFFTLIIAWFAWGTYMAAKELDDPLYEKRNWYKKNGGK